MSTRAQQGLAARAEQGRGLMAARAEHGHGRVTDFREGEFPY